MTNIATNTQRLKIITKNTPQCDILELAPACGCRECQHGCRFGSGIFAKGEVEKLARFLNVGEEEAKEKFLEHTEQFGQTLLRPKIRREGKPYGQCTFFDEEKGCTVHEAKPLQCKVAMGCKPYGEELMLWFMLNHIIDTTDANSVRQYARYLASGGKTLPGGQLHELITDQSQLSKMLNYSMLK